GDLVGVDSKRIGADLREHGLVRLALRTGARVHGRTPVGLQANRGALERSDSGPLHVAGDTDSHAAVGRERRLALGRYGFSADQLGCAAKRPRVVPAVEHEWLAVPVQDAGVVG